jgi:hypothetical protein
VHEVQASAVSGVLGSKMARLKLLISLVLAISTFGIVAAGGGSAQATFFDGNELWTYCNNRFSSEGNAAMCTAYILGVVDAAQQAQANSPGSSCTLKIPENVSGRQIADIVVKALEQHPENRPNSAPSIVLSAVVDAFPCSQ